MTADNAFRRLRGAFGNALIWAGGWFIAALALFGTLRVAGILPDRSWTEVLVTAVRAGIVGGVAGAAFSSVIGLLYHGRRLSEISWVRFGIAGGILTGLFVPVFLQSMNWLSGDGLVPWELVLDDGLWTALFGGAAAGGSLKLAQYTDTSLTGRAQEQVGRPEEMERLTSPGEGEAR